MRERPHVTRHGCNVLPAGQLDVFLRRRGADGFRKAKDAEDQGRKNGMAKDSTLPAMKRPSRGSARLLSHLPIPLHGQNKRSRSFKRINKGNYLIVFAEFCHIYRLE